ncbi:hypothetical protein [Aliidongia dinghuensis]|uniref:hypothetical protein n=1 Tax=Aliidongia dinghuensis TaxID=1867774 RepID=UPI00166C08D3|nr:hypothetical protein [Aliidongia dinghuensis]
MSLVSTLSPGEFAPVRLEIIGKDEAVTAELLERRLHHLRQVYAVALLVDDGREDDLASVLRDNPLADLERELIAEEDKLVVREASPGSLWLSLIAKSKQARRALVYACAVPFAKGREALLRRVVAGTALMELEVLAKAQDLRLKGAHGLIDLAKKIDKIKDKDTRELIRQRLLADMMGLTPTGLASSNTPALDYSPPLRAAFTSDDTPVLAELENKQKKTGAGKKRGSAKRLNSSNS